MIEPSDLSCAVLCFSDSFSRKGVSFSVLLLGAASPLFPTLSSPSIENVGIGFVADVDGLNL